jgi:hypothetical protein
MKGMRELLTTHGVASSPADAIAQWFNAGGMLDFYDFPIEVYINVSLTSSLYLMKLCNE